MQGILRPTSKTRRRAHSGYAQPTRGRAHEKTCLRRPNSFSQHQPRRSGGANRGQNPASPPSDLPARFWKSRSLEAQKPLATHCKEGPRPYKNGRGSSDVSHTPLHLVFPDPKTGSTPAPWPPSKSTTTDACCSSPLCTLGRRRTASPPASSSWRSRILLNIRTAGRVSGEDPVPRPRRL